MGREGHRMVIKNGSGNSSSRSNFTWPEQIQKLAFICTSPRNSLYLLFWWAEVRKKKWKGFPQRPSAPPIERKRSSFHFVGQECLKGPVLGIKSPLQSFMIYAETLQCQHFQMFRSLLENKTYFQKFLGLEVQISFTLRRSCINSALLLPQGCSWALTSVEKAARPVRLLKLCKSTDQTQRAAAPTLL